VVVVSLALDDSWQLEHDPERVADLTTRWAQTLGSCFVRHGGAVSYGSGELVAIFGLEEAREDDALRACRAAVEARAEHSAFAAVVRLGDALVLRGAVDAGELVVTGGDASRATGPVLARTGRLAVSAGPGELLLGDALLALVGDGIERAGEDGRTLVSVSRAAEAIPRHLTRPLVGRAGELDALTRRVQECLELSLAGLTVVVGPAGIGKSRLVAELTWNASEGGALVLRGRCLPDEEGIAFAPLHDVVQELLGSYGRDGLARDVAEGGDPIATVSRFVGIAGEGDTASTREETFLAIRRIFEGIATRRPLLLVIEDLHWAEPTLVDLLEDLAGTATGPIAIVATARPEMLDLRAELAAERPRCGSIMLAPLPEAACLELFEGIPLGPRISRRARRRIATASGGNPLFIEQLVAMSNGDGAADDLQVPPTLRALLAARVDRLSALERSALEIGAILGEWFEPGQVTTLAGTESSEHLPGALEALVAKDVLRASASGFTYTIAHPLIRTTVYESIGKRRRADLHERYAELLEASGADVPDDVQGHHLDRAFRYRLEVSVDDSGLQDLGRRARAKLAAAGRRSLTSGDLHTAVNLLGRAASATVDPEDVPPELLLELGDGLREAGRLAEAEQTLQRGRAAARAHGNELLEWRTQASIVRVLLQLHGNAVEEIASLADETLETLTELGDKRGLSVAWWAQAWIAWLGCRAADAEAALEHSIDCARQVGDERAEAHSANLHLGAGLFGPSPVEHAIKRCLALQQRHSSRPRLVASAARALCVLRAMQGEFDKARELVALDQKILEELGMRYLAAAATEAYGFVELLAGNPAEAERLLRGGYDELALMGDHSAFPTVAAMLGEALFQCERYDEAVEVTLAAERSADERDLQAQVQWRLPQAKAFAARRRGKRAVAIAEEACRLAEGTDFLNLQADAFAALAEVCRRLGHAPQAHTAISRAVELYERKGNAVAAARARVLQQALGSASTEPVRRKPMRAAGE
jgi:tetratricopeptide (TPR) repeat protein